MEDKQVMLPENVATWLERCKLNDLSIGQAINNVTPKIDENVFNWFWDSEGRQHQIDFTKAWIYGYTIEPDLYIVEIPNPESSAKFGLYKNELGHVVLGRLLYIEGSIPANMKLTEEEIEKDFPWVFEHGFVKKV